MPTHDYVIDNQTAPNFRADLNSALQAIVSNNSSTSAPTVTYANMIWYDTTNKLLRMRNEADDAFITLGTLDQVAGTFAVASSTNAANLTGTATSNIQSSALASGTANSTTFLRGDRTWQTLDVTPTTAQVLNATAGASAGAVGTYAFLGVNNASHSNTFGETRAGSSLFPAGISASAGFAVNGFGGASSHGGQNSARAGTWRCMGVVRSLAGGAGDPSNFGASLWLRIS